MRTWTAAERYAWARYHCLVFGNCTKAEGANRSRATSVAAGLASMALSREYGDVTGSEYLVLARTVHAQRDKKPWFDPWLIKGAIELETAAQA